MYDLIEQPRRVSNGEEKQDQATDAHELVEVICWGFEGVDHCERGLYHSSGQAVCHWRDLRFQIRTLPFNPPALPS